MEQTTQERTPDRSPLNGESINVSRKQHEETRPMRESSRQFSLDSIISPIEETIERTFNKFMNRGWLRSTRDDRDSFEAMSPFDGFSMRWPKIDVVDQDNEVLVRAELPGVNKDDLDVSLSENMLTLRGQTRREQRVEKDNYFRSEISQGSFLRSVYLPVEVDSENATASLKDGILEVKLPKIESAKRKSIQVQ